METQYWILALVAAVLVLWKWMGLKLWQAAIVLMLGVSISAGVGGSINDTAREDGGGQLMELVDRISK